MSSFSIETDFSPTENGSPEERATMAEIRILAGNEVLTRVDDSWAQSVRERVRVSCYPLALWVANSWWRLLSEAPSVQHDQALGWRMAHEMSAAGGGYLWPRITFAPDGEHIEVSSRPSLRVLAEPLRYLTRANISVPAWALQRELSRFVSVVIERLAACGLHDSELGVLWAEVEAERADPMVARARGLEAELGFEPDEGPEPVLHALKSLEPVAGATSVDELANAVSSSSELWVDPTRLIHVIDGAKAGGGTPANFNPLLDSIVPTSSAAPWERGRSVAAKLRERLGLVGGKIPTSVLEDLLGTHLLDEHGLSPVGLAVRGNARAAKLHFRGRTRQTSRRFEAARFITQQVLSPLSSRWLVSTDAATATQKAQRAGATEFLVPAVELKNRLNGDFSQEAIEATADYYEVSPLMIWSHLANNGMLSSEQVRVR